MCGNRGCLEALASIPAIESRVAAALGLASIDFDTVTERYLDGDTCVSDTVNKTARWAGTAVGNLINFLTPSEIILGGPLLKLGEDYVTIIKEAAREIAFPAFLEDLTITPSSLKDESGALGSTVSLFQGFLEGEVHG